MKKIEVGTNILDFFPILSGIFDISGRHFPQQAYFRSWCITLITLLVIIFRPYYETFFFLSNMRVNDWGIERKKKLKKKKKERRTERKKTNATKRMYIFIYVGNGKNARMSTQNRKP